MPVLNIDGHKERNDDKTDEKNDREGKSGKAGMSGGGRDRLEREKENVINLTANNKLS